MYIMYCLIQITVYKAVQDETGKVLKGYRSNLIEIEASRDDLYDTILSRATEALHIEPERRKIYLYKPSTACIPNMDLTVKSVKKKWTLGNYLLAVKKVPSQIKFGVGYVECQTEACMHVVNVKYSMYHPM